MVHMVIIGSAHAAPSLLMNLSPARDQHPPQHSPPLSSARLFYQSPDGNPTDRTSMLFTYGIFFARGGGRRLPKWTKAGAGCLALGFALLIAPLS